MSQLRIAFQLSGIEREDPQLLLKLYLNNDLNSSFYVHARNIGEQQKQIETSWWQFCPTWNRLSRSHWHAPLLGLIPLALFLSIAEVSVRHKGRHRSLASHCPAAAFTSRSEIDSCPKSRCRFYRAVHLQNSRFESKNCQIVSWVTSTCLVNIRAQTLRNTIGTENVLRSRRIAII